MNSSIWLCLHMDPSMDGELARLSEGLITSREIAHEWLQSGVSVDVLDQILRESEVFLAESAHILLRWSMNLKMPSKVLLCIVFLTAT